MTSEGEMIGDIAQSALVARAIEPTHGETADDGHSHESQCLNCGTMLVGAHCHGCGQAAHVHRTLGAFFHDLLHGVLHFEGKIWRTLPLLIWRPGRLTREYIDGRRASYVGPVALFLFSVFVMFAVIPQFGSGIEVNPAQAADLRGGVVAGLDATRAELAKLQTRRAELVRQGKPTEEIDRDIAGVRTAMGMIDTVKGGTGAGDREVSRLQTNVPWIDHMVASVRENPSLVLYKLRSNAYKFSWALIPLSVPFVWLLFAWRRRFTLYDHTVFVTYSLCFMTLLVVVLTLAGAAGAPLTVLAAVLIPPLHMYRHVKGTYQLSRLSALWRTAALLIVAFTALLAFAALLIAQSAG